MYDIGYKLIIIDEGVERAAQVMKKQMELFNTKLQELLLELDEVQDDAIMVGRIADNLSSVTLKMYGCLYQTPEIGGKIENLLTEYLAEIEAADGNIYINSEVYDMYGECIVENRNGNDMIRDYSLETLVAVHGEMLAILDAVEQQEECVCIPAELYPYVEFTEEIYRMKQTQIAITDEVREAIQLWDVELQKVHEVEERYAAKLLEIKDLIQVYAQSVSKLVQMLYPEKIRMATSFYEAQLEGIMKPYYEKRSEIELLTQYLTDMQLENLKALGYTSQSLLELYEDFNETDVEFIAYLAEGTQEGYEHAFAINPDKLSEKMKYVLADYAIHLFEAEETENCTGLELLCNAMLSVTEGSSSESMMQVYAYDYTELMCSYTRNLLIGDTIYLAGMEPEAAEYPLFCEMHFNKMTMLSLWETQSELLNDVPGGVMLSRKLTVEDMVYEGNGSFSFWASNEMGFGEQKTIDKITTTLYASPGDLSNAISIEYLEAEREKIEAQGVSLDAEACLSFMWNLICMHPAMKVAATAGMIKDGIECLPGATELVTGMLQETVLSIKEKAELFRQWGIGGGYFANNEVHLCFYGLYDYEIYRDWLIIEQDGYGAFMGWSENLVSDIEERIKNDIEEAQKKGALVPNFGLHMAVLNGGFSFVSMSYINESGKAVKVSVEELLSVIKLITQYKENVGREEVK